MKNSTRLQYHPNQEDKSGNPTFASNVNLNFSANEPLATEPEHTASSTKSGTGLIPWLQSIIRRKK